MNLGGLLFPWAEFEGVESILRCWSMLYVLRLEKSLLLLVMLATEPLKLLRSSITCLPWKFIGWEPPKLLWSSSSFWFWLNCDLLMLLKSSITWTVFLLCYELISLVSWFALRPYKVPPPMLLKSSTTLTLYSSVYLDFESWPLLLNFDISLDPRPLLTMSLIVRVPTLLKLSIIWALSFSWPGVTLPSESWLALSPWIVLFPKLLKSSTTSVRF